MPSNPINSNILSNNSNLPVILTNTSEHKICIPCNITIGTSETINNLNYNINDISFDNTSDIHFQNANTIEPILNGHNHNMTQIHTINKTQNVTTYVKTDDHNKASIKTI